MKEWITDRPPTEADGDMDGDVRMIPAPHAGPDAYLLVHWSHVGNAAPWQHAENWQPPAQPAPAEPDRIAALEERMAGRIAALEQQVAELEERFAGLRTAVASAFELLRPQS